MGDIYPWRRDPSVAQDDSLHKAALHLMKLANIPATFSYDSLRYLRMLGFLLPKHGIYFAVAAYDFIRELALSTLEPEIAAAYQKHQELLLRQEDALCQEDFALAIELRDQKQPVAEFLNRSLRTITPEEIDTALLRAGVDTQYLQRREMVEADIYPRQEDPTLFPQGWYDDWLYYHASQFRELCFCKLTLRVSFSIDAIDYLWELAEPLTERGLLFTHRAGGFVRRVAMSVCLTPQQIRALERYDELHEQRFAAIAAGDSGGAKRLLAEENRLEQVIAKIESNKECEVSREDVVQALRRVGIAADVAHR